MLPADVLRQIRRLHIRARRAVDNVLGGEYRSVFKGTGISFEEVREYQPGDDVRAIDWNVTARMGHPFIKRHVEERELTVMLMVDWSGSQQFSSGGQSKREVAAELGAILAFSAISNNDKVGLIGFTDRVERFVPPRKGARHVLRLIRDILFHQPANPGTSLANALDFLNHIQHRRAIIFILSDFLDNGFMASLKRTGRYHDVVAVRITDSREQELPNVGLVNLQDLETKAHILVDTKSARLREAFARQAQERMLRLRQNSRAARVELLDVVNDGGHLEALVQFFQRKERRPGRR